MTKTILLFLIVLMISIVSTGCSKKLYPLEGIETTKAGEFTDFEGGRIYLPKEFDFKDLEEWPVTVILHGYGILSIGLSAKYFWEEYAEELGIVLFFVETGHQGWYEMRNSYDTKLISQILKDFRSFEWTKPGGIQLFGWSAGAIMAHGFLPINKKQKDGSLLFNRFVAVSGGFGTIMEEELKKNPTIKKAERIPLFICWGQKEPSDHGKDSSEYLREQGYSVETMTHEGAHDLVASLVYQALLRNRK